MAGGTHVFDMIKRLKANDALRKMRYFQKRGDVLRGTKTPAPGSDEPDNMRINVRRGRSRVRFILSLILTVVTICGIIALVLGSFKIIR